MKDQFKVEETIEHNGEVLFTVLSRKGTDYLVEGDRDNHSFAMRYVVDSIFGGYRNRFKIPEDWLKALWEIENDRCDKIQQKIDSLQEEMDCREKIIVAMEKVLP